MDNRKQIDNIAYQPLFCKEMTEKFSEIISESESFELAAKSITAHVLEYTEWLQLQCTVGFVHGENGQYVALWEVAKRFIPEGRFIGDSNPNMYRTWIEYIKYGYRYVFKKEF